MIINLAYIKGQLKLQSTNLKNQPIGSVIKFKRKEYAMTLEEAAEGICSISYLSKLENNRINPNDKYLEYLCERLNISQIEENDIDYKDDLKLIIRKILLLERIDELIGAKYQKKTDYQAKLFLMGYYVANKEFDLAYNSYYEMRIYLKNLDDFETEFCLCMLSIIAYYIGDYSDSYHLLKLAEKNSFSNLYLLKQIMKIKNAIYMNKFAVMSLFYNDLLDELINHQYYEMADHLKIKQIIYYASFQDVEATRISIDKLNRVAQNIKDYILAIACFYHHRFDKAIKIIKPIYQLQEDFLLLYLQILDYMQERHEILKVISDIPFKLNEGRQTFIQYLNVKYQNDNETVMLFIKNKFFDSNSLLDEYKLLVYFLEEGKNAFKKAYFYKDALTLESKIIPKLRLLLLV